MNKTPLVLSAVLIGIIAMMFLFSGCRKAEVPEAQDSNAINAAEGSQELPPEEDIDDSTETVSEIENETTTENETETPISEEKPASFNPNDLLKKSCTEQIYVGLRSCDRTDGKLNISLSNIGYKNITMYFSMKAGGNEISYVYFDDLFESKSERIYTINLKDIEDIYGGIDMMYATPVYYSDSDNKSLLCINKILPISVSSCH